MKNVSRRVFLSFLGNTRYVESNYYPEGEPDRQIDGVAYAAEALLQLFADDYEADDRVFVFTTKAAWEANWKDAMVFNPDTGKEDIPNVGLESRLKQLNTRRAKAEKSPLDFNAVMIPEGFTEQDIWEIFKIIYECLKSGDEVTLDITSAFRSIPMLGLSLLHYAKALKRIKVAGIYYGAFQKLGHAGQVRQMDIEKRNAPILDLTAFSALQDWTAAAEDVVEHGRMKRLGKFTHKTTNSPSEQTTGVLDDAAILLRDVASRLDKFDEIVRKNRGKEILDLDESEFWESIYQIGEAENLVPALKPILETIRTNLQPLRNSPDPIWLETVRWRKKYRLTQQGITQLQEGVLTELCDYFSQDPNYSTQFNKLERQTRDLLSKVLIERAKRESEPPKMLRGELKKNEALTRALFRHPVIKNLAKPYKKLIDTRNDINHGGYSKQPNTVNSLAKKFEKNLTEIEAALRNISKKYEPPHVDATGEDEPPAAAPTLHLLFSHQLTDAQLADARASLDVTQIAPLPADLQQRWQQVPPDLESLDGYAQPFVDYLRQHARPGDPVLISGEYGLTVLLVKAAKKQKLKPVYATTRREVVERLQDDGSVVTERVFRHVRFRAYA